ncbi:hypothetical protein ANO14919_000420 [Xylariales sp. No.14919]|nr:hypothetical protein ANO14919_000420 [Xylariales sp. No.14919]
MTKSTKGKGCLEGDVQLIDRQIKKERIYLRRSYNSKEHQYA